MEEAGRGSVKVGVTNGESMVRMCAVQLKDWKIAKELVKIMELNETTAQSVIANSVCWHSNRSRNEDGHVLRRTLQFEATGGEGQWKRGTACNGHGEEG